MKKFSWNNFSKHLVTLHTTNVDLLQYFRILTAFSSGNSGKEETSLRVRTLKTLLATLCAGKLMDKLRYIFSQLADSNGHLVHNRWASRSDVQLKHFYWPLNELKYKVARVPVNALINHQLKVFKTLREALTGANLNRFWYGFVPLVFVFVNNNI